MATGIVRFCICCCVAAVVLFSDHFCFASYHSNEERTATEPQQSHILCAHKTVDEIKKKGKKKKKKKNNENSNY